MYIKMKKWIFVCSMIWFSMSCQSNSDNKTKAETQKIEEDVKVGLEENDGEPPQSKTIEASFEGMGQKMKVFLYESPQNFALPFYTYLPKDWQGESVSSGEGDVILFMFNEAQLILTVLPENTTEKEALEMARQTIANEGEVGVPEMDSVQVFYLANSSGIAMSTEVGQNNGRYYYWMERFPLEYADGVGPVTEIIKGEVIWE